MYMCHPKLTICKKIYGIEQTKMKKGIYIAAESTRVTIKTRARALVLAILLSTLYGFIQNFGSVIALNTEY